MYAVLGNERGNTIERFNILHNALLNMTYLALRFSRYVNGVSMQHGKVSQQMFPDYHVHAITNGVHAATWLSDPMQELLDEEIPEWRHDNHYFRSVYGIAPAKISNCHASPSSGSSPRSTSAPALQFNPKMLTLGFARRVATYKRADLLFHDPKRLSKIAKKIGGLQILFAGKAHPADAAGKGLIRDVFSAAASLRASGVLILYLENYDWDLGRLLTQGVDVRVNTPRRPYEASGTSGMKAALNGVPRLACSTAGGSRAAPRTSPAGPSTMPRTRTAKPPASTTSWRTRSPRSMPGLTPGPASSSTASALTGSFFNTHRMLGQYFNNAYFPQMSEEEAVPIAVDLLEGEKSISAAKGPALAPKEPALA